MKLNKIMVTALVGTMLVGSLVANANAESKDTKVMSSTSAKATAVKSLSKEELANFEEQRENVAPGIAIKIGKTIDTINFEDLSEELQTKLIERFGEAAETMVFINEEMAEAILAGEGFAMPIAATMTSATPLSEEELAKLREQREENMKQGVEMQTGTTTLTTAIKTS